MQSQIRYLHGCLFKPQEFNIHEFICHVNEMVECIEQLPPFGKDQVLIEYEFLELVEFDIQCKWKKHLIVQGFESGDNILNGLVNFCKNIETAKEIFNDRGDG